MGRDAGFIIHSSGKQTKPGKHKPYTETLKDKIVENTVTHYWTRPHYDNGSVGEWEESEFMKGEIAQGESALRALIENWNDLAQLNAKQVIEARQSGKVYKPGSVPTDPIMWEYML